MPICIFGYFFHVLALFVFFKFELRQAQVGSNENGVATPQEESEMGE